MLTQAFIDWLRSQSPEDTIAAGDAQFLLGNAPSHFQEWLNGHTPDTQLTAIAILRVYAEGLILNLLEQGDQTEGQIQARLLGLHKTIVDLALVNLHRLGKIRSYAQQQGLATVQVWTLNQRGDNQ